MIRRYFLLFISHILFAYCTVAQHTGSSFTLSQPINSDGENTYTASNYVLLTPGFSAQASSTKSFTANIGGVLTIPTGEIFGGSDENNEGGVVGEIPLQFYVNEAGAAICNVSFDLPTGLNGLTPELGLNYNSQRLGEGIMGEGWGIQGVSSISKAPWNYYYNEGSSSIQFSFEDQLMLDGQYLIKSGNEYRTERESFDKIVLFDAANMNNGFKVFKPNGLVYYYGTETDARLSLQNDKPIAWYLKKIEDMNGNTIEYSYESSFNYGWVDKGCINLIFVKYGGNSDQSIPHKYRVQFSYRPHYAGGYGWKKYFTSSSTSGINYTHDVWELDSVRLQYDENGSFEYSTRIWKYMFHYENSFNTDKRQLEKVSFTRSGQKYNPLKFEWQGNESNHPLEQSGLKTNDILFDIISTDESQIQLMTFRHKEPQEYSAHLDHLMCYYLSDGSHVFQWYNNTSFNAQGNVTNFSLDVNSTKSHTVRGIIKGFKIWDIDNDGDDELIYIKDHNSDYRIHVVKLGSSITDTEVATFSNLNFEWLAFGDFDGNGYLDLVYQNASRQIVWLLSDENGHFYKDVPFTNLQFGGNIKQYYVGRFSGAQKDEFILRLEESNQQKAYYMGLQPSTSNPAPEKVEITGDAKDMLISAVPNQSCFTGDFNNDGKTDFIAIEGSTMTIYLSAGKGVFVKESITNSPLVGLPWSEYPVRYVITDANGDGYDDLIAICREAVYDPSHVSYKQHYYRYDCLLSPLSGNFRFINEWGDNKFEVMPYSGEIEFPIQEQRLHLLRGNFIGSSSNHLLIVNFDVFPGKKVYSRLTGIYPQYGHVIKKITGSMGDVTTIEYAPLSDRVSVESPIGILPLAYYRGNECVVTKFTQDNGLSRSFSYNSRYYFHKLGKGFLGFKSVTETDDRTGTVTTKNFTLNDTYYFMYPATTLVKQNNTNGKTISETTYTFSTKPIGETNEKRYYLCLDQDKTVEYDVSGILRKTTTTKYQDHDEFYNPKTITFTVADESNRSFTKTSYVTYKNITSQDKYFIGLKDTLREYFVDGVEVKTEFIYYNNGMLKTKKTFYDKPKPITETYYYDAVGNITSIVQSAVGLPSRTNSFVYTDDKRFKKTGTNALGQTEHFQYYPTTGLIKQSTDYNGHTTYYYYDAMGRLEKTAFPDGRFSLTARFWKGDEKNAPDNTLHYTWSQTSGESPTWTYYDKYGREIRNLYQNVTTSSYVAVDKTYGSGFKFDLIQDESLPYIIGGGGGDETKGDPPTIYWKNHQYNNLRQLTTLSYPDTSLQKYDYEKNTVTFTDRDSIVYIKTYHGNGLIRELTSNGTKIEFLYTKDGLPAGTKHNGNDQLSESILYDEYRRPYQQKEMNRGTTTLLYNGWGELREKQEPAGITNYLYDALGRMTEKTAPDHIITWKYDDGYQAIGSITEETFKATDESYQVTKKYEYDYRTNLKKETQTISGEDAWAFEYAYDAIGQLKKTRYPSEFELYLTWKYGWLTEMKDKDDKSLWKAGSINAFGQYKTESLGIASKNISITYTYLDYNARLEEVMLRSTNAVQVRQSYHWLTTGNLHSRKNELSGHIERFAYDDFNRLTTVTLNNIQTLSTTYDPLGNPDNRTGFGDIACLNANLPHAVTLTSAVPDAYQGMNQTAIYNSLNKVKSMNETDYQTGKQNHAYQAWYGASEELVRQRITSSSTITTRRIFGPYETETGMTAKNYVYLPDGSLVGWAAGNNFYYTLRDHLGSIIAIVDQDGNVQQQLSYDAWGRRRDPTTWNYNANLPTPLTSKGFTGHDHLDNFKLINMGGRMYDPVIGRFLNPDIIVQFPENPQSYNRYSYCLNNPLKYTDPTGWAEWELNKKTGRITWLNDNEHFIEKDDIQIEIDKLINSVGKSLDVTKGVLREFAGDNPQNYAFTNAVEAEDFYYFVAQSSTVEWAFARVRYPNEDATGFVGTNNGSDNTIMTALYEKIYGPFINLMSHSHPLGGSGYGHPSYNIWTKDGYVGDLNSAKNSPYTFQREVYDVAKDKIYEYSKNTFFPHWSERDKKTPYFDKERKK